MFLVPEEPVDLSRQPFFLYLYTDELPALREHLLANGVSVSEIHSPPYMPSGEISVPDPDGYRILVAQWGTAEHQRWERERRKRLAVGIVAARLTFSRLRAHATVGLIQASMLAGSLFPIFTAYRDIASLQVFSIPACACLLLFGFLALEDEWRYKGVRSALGAAAPGLIGWGLAALGHMGGSAMTSLASPRLQIAMPFWPLSSRRLRQ